MEADIDHLFRNDSSKEYDSIYDSRLYEQIHLSIQIIFCIIGLIFDSTIIFILYNSKMMKNRTNTIILNWAACDALFLFLSPSFVTMFMDREFIIKHYEIYCVVDGVEIIFQLACVLLILCLFSNTIFKSKILKDFIMFGVLYGGLLLLFFYNIYRCRADYGGSLFYTLSGFLMLGVLLFLLFKELHTCYRCIRKKPVSSNTNFRKNVGRIYLYGWVVSTFLYGYGLPYGLEYIVLYLVGYMSSVYITIYMAYANNNFKMCLLNLWRCKWNQYDVDLAIAFADDSETEEVNTTINFINENFARESTENV